MKDILKKLDTNKNYWKSDLDRNKWRTAVRTCCNDWRKGKFNTQNIKGMLQKKK